MGRKARSKRQGRQSLPPTIELPPRIADVIDRASEGDRVWFELHPDADVRRRPPIEGEFWPQELTSVTHVLVYQVRPGLRIRFPVLRLTIPESEMIQ
jgi:hypothetical protein